MGSPWAYMRLEALLHSFGCVMIVDGTVSKLNIASDLFQAISNCLDKTYHVYTCIYIIDMKRDYTCCYTKQMVMNDV